jgi:hypothetical protein
MLDGANTSALLLAQAVPSFSRSELRWELANIAAAVALLSVALAAIALFCFRRTTRDLTLIYFSLFCILYAVRLLAYLPSFRALFDESRMFWSYLGWVSSIIILPGGLFLYQLVGNTSESSFAGFSPHERCSGFSESSPPRVESLRPNSASQTTSSRSPRSRPARCSWSPADDA